MRKSLNISLDSPATAWQATQRALPKWAGAVSLSGPKRHKAGWLEIPLPDDDTRHSQSPRRAVVTTALGV